MAAAREGIALTISDAVRELPHFDPDLEGAPPETALRFLTACESAPAPAGSSATPDSGEPCA
jgi:hypothetical protein